MAAACAAIFIAAAAAIPAQGPGQAPGQIPQPPIYIPRVGGQRPERPQSETPTEGLVYVVLWFDTEDYILPQSDDAAKRIAVFLTEEGIPATFKIVGEKARVLERRGRLDVIAALAHHEIGYHSNTHSQHPTVAEYEADLDWDAGAAEFNRRERPGFDDVARIFKKNPTAYGQPGASWAPQAYPALQKWGVHVYLDDGKQVGLRGAPFWYGGLLNIFNIRGSEQFRPDENWSNLNMAKTWFQDTYLTMTSRKAGGLLSIYFHPCEFVHRQFWDALNFSGGANPPADQWKIPAMKSPEDSEHAFEYLENLVRFLRSFPRVQFLTASGAAARFHDRAQNHLFSSQEVGVIASQVDPQVSFQTGDTFNLSASEVLYVLNKYLAGFVRRLSAEPLLLERTPYGPAAAVPPLDAKIVAPWSQVSRAVLDVQDAMDKTGRIPESVLLGNQRVPPESYLAGIGPAVQSLMQNAALPGSVTFPPARLAAADYVADDSPEIWDWVIFPRGFHAPKLMSLAKLQAWTLKPVK